MIAGKSERYLPFSQALEPLTTNENKRLDLHVHSLFSDGVLLPSEILRMAAAQGYGAIAITDHADASNLDAIVSGLVRFAQEQRGDFPLTFVPGVELTHTAPASIAPLAWRARRLGAGLVVVHGETIVEPVIGGTNRAAVECTEVDILAHPGLITLEEAQIAAENGVYLEITSRSGHCITNGHVVQIARRAGAKLVLNTDTHTPGDMIDQEMACLVAAGAGLSEEEIHIVTTINPQALVQRALSRYAPMGRWSCGQMVGWSDGRKRHLTTRPRTTRPPDQNRKEIPIHVPTTDRHCTLPPLRAPIRRPGADHH